MKYHEHLAAGIRSGREEQFQTAGVVTYVSFAFTVQDGERAISRVCVVDEMEEKVNYLLVADLDFDERIHYTLLSEADFEGLPSSLFCDYSLDLSMGVDYALKKLAESK